MKIKIILLLTLTLAGLSGCGQVSVNYKKDTVTSNWKIYTNDSLGFTFQYPNTWYKNGQDAKVINRYGTIAAVEISFIDTVSKTSILIAYHFAPMGAELYKYAVSQYDSSISKEIKVAGNNAIVAITKLNIDGRGKALNLPLKLIIVDFLDKKQTGEIELQFKTPLTDEDSEIAKFNQLLSSFKFIN
jgi:hypothetical protein